MVDARFAKAAEGVWPFSAAALPAVRLTGQLNEEPAIVGRRR